MFKTWRAGMGILGTSRLPLRVQARIRRDGGMTQVQGVRFKRVFRPRNLIGTTLSLFILYNIFERVVFEPVDKFADELEQELDEKTRNELIQQSNAGLFLRLPFTIEKFEGRPYRRMDPEVQEYDRLCKDTKLMRKLRDDLVEFTKGTVEDYLQIPHGARKARKSKSWLEIRIPARPPPVYLQSGILIGGEHLLAYAKIPVESMTVKRIERALYPVPVLCAMWAWAKVMLTPGDPKETTVRIALSVFPQLSAMAKAERDRLARTEGLPPRVEPKIGPAGPVGPQPPSAQHNGLEQMEAATSKEADAASKEELRAASDAAAKLKEEQGQVPKPGSKEELREQERNLVEMVNNANPFASRYVYAAKAFRLELQRRWRKIVDDPPRGGLHVFGVVEITVNQKRVVMDVSAWWDPKTNRYDPNSIQLALKQVSSNFKELGQGQGR